jgi:tRNA(Met) C34 N-acetyltransferase TmcA
MKDNKIIDVVLTPHQQEKEIAILNGVYSGKLRIVLNGSAGVGKTTLVNFLIEKFAETMTGFIYIAAPTHKALGVLQSKISMEEGQDPIVFSTVHAGLKLKQQINKKTGEKYFVQKFRRGDEPFKACSLLIIDEGSMITQYQLDLLSQYNFSIIFVGDEKQINPVKEIHSPVFHQGWHTVELLEMKFA